MSRFTGLFILMLVAVLLLAACSTATATPAPPPATEAPAVEEPTAPPEATAEPEAEAATDEEAVTSLMMENPPVTVLTQRAIEDVIGVKEAAMAAVSPDGTTIAWIKPDGGLLSKEVAQLCLYGFASAANQCVDKPGEYNSYPAQLAWSPDSAYITFSENPIQLGHESDIWVFDVAAGEFANLTDDGQYGSWSTMEAGTYTLDYLPMWNAADGLIYFWRSIPSGDLSATFDLYRVSPTGGEAELVRDLPDSVTVTLPVWDFEFFYMNGPSAIAPDGSKAAVIMRTVLEPTAESQSDGLWIIDLADAEAEPQRIATMVDFQAAMPPWQEFPAVPLALSWTSDSQGIVTLAQSNDLQNQINIFYYVDAKSGEMTPINDFSGVTERESYYTSADPQQLPPRFYSPWTATISPAGDKLLMWNDLSGASGMFVSVQPPDGTLPGLVYVSDTSTSFTRTRVSTSNDGKVIMYGLLFTVEEE